MTTTVRKFAVGVATAALVAGVAAPAMAAGDSDVLPGVGAAKLDRLAGADRIATSLAVADHAFRNLTKPTTVYIANSADAHLIDAATAGMITDGPVVFVNNNSYVAEAVGRALADVTTYPSFGGFAKVVALGGTSSISDETLDTVVKQVGATAKDRIAGDTRYDTAVAIADYIYGKALKKTDGYGALLSPGTTNLKRVYIANGDDSHLVDAMVSGTLDDGPILLAGPNGELSEKTKEFIKKTLPGEFAALGGTVAVADSTINEAWLVKALANDWTESYDIPSLKANATKYEFLINGYDNTTTGVPLSRNPKDFNFMGLNKAVKEANDVRQLWSTKYEVAKLNASQALAKYLKANNNLTADQFLAAIKGATATFTGYDDADNAAQQLQEFVGQLIVMYGDAVATEANATTAVEALDSVKADTLKPFLALSDGKVTGFSFAGFESSKKFTEKVSQATDAITRWWTQGNVSADLIANKDGSPNYTAIASQKESVANAITTLDTNNGASVVTSTVNNDKAMEAPLAAVKAVTAWVADQVEANRKATQDALDAAQGKLRVALDKIAPKTVLRLGGATRYETAAWIANEWAKNETGIRVDNDLDEVYVANGVRPADAIVGGQLKRGPILLVPAEGEIPAATISTAKNLPLWNRDNQVIGVRGIGGTTVLPEAQLQKVVDAVNSGVSASSNASPVQLQNSTVTIHVNSTGASSVETAVYANQAFATAVTSGNLTAPVSYPTGAQSANYPVVTFANGKLSVSAPNTPASNFKVGTYVYKIEVPGVGSTYLTVKAENLTRTNLSATVATAVNAGAAVNLKATPAGTVSAGAITVKEGATTLSNATLELTDASISFAGDTYSVTDISNGTNGSALLQVETKTSGTATNAAEKSVTVTVKENGYNDATVTVPFFVKIQ